MHAERYTNNHQAGATTAAAHLVDAPGVHHVTEVNDTGHCRVPRLHRRFVAVEDDVRVVVITHDDSGGEVLRERQHDLFEGINDLFHHSPLGRVRNVLRELSNVQRPSQVPCMVPVGGLMVKGSKGLRYTAQEHAR